MGTGSETSEALEHRFGGPWTELKLDAVEYYLQFYTQALKDKPSPDNPFILWYVDAFAGTGDRSTEQITGGLFEGTPAQLKTVRLAGSVGRALNVVPTFQRFVFIEQRPEFCAALESLKSDHPGRTIECIQGDANEVLPRLFGSTPWTGQRRWGDPLHRAVVFLDPYNLVEWSTLECLAATKAIDLWFLFPIASVLRQAARSYDAIDTHKAAYLDRAFGTLAWRTDLYKPALQTSLLSDLEVSPTRGERPEVEAYVKQRLETLFPYVSQPLPLLLPAGAQLFSLFFAAANPSKPAVKLARHCMNDLLKKYGRPASHRKSPHR